ncbi:sugar kinase [Amaricoccus tamworthensis]|uniref:sugar kinase n=1 Tax=Amaricoccus tamworthensis TaxID=57002 RepID=UPI003C7A0B43
MRFLAIGECMAELAPASKPGDYHLGFAGDTFNTAWYLARVGPEDCRVSYFSAIGQDEISRQMRDAISAGGIDTEYLLEVADQTVGLYLISLNNGERSFSYWRGQSAARHLADDPGSLRRAMENSDVIYFSGITLAILEEATRDTLFDALGAARASGKMIAFDPNLRPGLWPSPECMKEAVMQGAAVSDISLPSFEDEASWFGDADPEATAERYAAAGVDTVVVKNGAGPVLYRQSSECGVCEVPEVADVVDTTAAGDSFNAGVLAGLMENRSLWDSVSLGCRLAGKVVQGRGALVPVDRP